MTIDQENVQGCVNPVDHSGDALRQGGSGPSPLGTHRRAPEVLVGETGGSASIIDTDQAVIPPALSSRTGAGVEPPSPLFQSGPAQPDPSQPDPVQPDPIMFTDTANLELDSYAYPIYQPTKCRLKYIVLDCKCNRRIVPSVCMSLDCEPCAPHIGIRRSRHVSKRLLTPTPYQHRRNTRKTVIYTIFTVPLEGREKYYDRDEWQKVRKKAWLILKKHFGALYGIEATHPRGDKDVEKFHPHLNFLWIQRPGFSPYLDTSLLRKHWKDVLNVETVDVYCRYSDKLSQIYHWVKYVTRTFPGSHKWTGSMRWYGKYPKGTKLEPVICPDCGSRLTVVGFIDAQLVDEYWERGILLGRDPPWLREDCITRIVRRKA